MLGAPFLCFGVFKFSRALFGCYLKLPVRLPNGSWREDEEKLRSELGLGVRRKVAQSKVVATKDEKKPALDSIQVFLCSYPQFSFYIPITLAKSCIYKVIYKGLKTVKNTPVFSKWINMI